MGSNQSKPCCGVPERESRRAYQETVQELFRIQQAMVIPPDWPQEETCVYCREDELDQYLNEINIDPAVFHFEVENAPEIKDNSLEDGAKLRAAGISATVLEVVEVGEPGGDVTEKLEPSDNVMVSSEPKGGTMLGMGALLPELARILTSVCQQVFHALHVQKSSRDFCTCNVKRTKEQAAVEDLSLSFLESQPSVLSSGTQTRSPSFGTELQSSGDIHPPHEDAFMANAHNAPCRTDLDLATGDMLGTGKEQTSGPTELEHASSEETLVDTDETLSDVGTTEMADECSDVKTDLGTKEAAEILLSLGGDLPRAVSKPLPILNERQGKVSEDDYDGGNVDARLPKRACGMLATVDSEDKTEWPVVAEIVRTRQPYWRAIHTLCKKADVLVASDVLYSLPKDEAISVPKENGHQKSVVQNMEARTPTGVAEMTGTVSSPKALLETSEIEQDGPLSPSAEAIAQVNRNAQLSPKSVNISDPAMEDSAPSQRC